VTTPDAKPRTPSPPAAIVLALDVTVATARPALRATVVLARHLSSATRPVTSAVLRPPLDALARRGRPFRVVLLQDLAGLLDALLDVLVPAALEQVLRRVDVAAVLERHVDLDRLVAGVDLDAAAGRLDVDAVARHLDVAALLDQLDLTRIVREKVDLDDLVATVDIDAVAARLDLDAVVARLDLSALAEDVIATLDVPEIIRASTSAVSSETMREVRMRGIAADDVVSRAADRLRIRRHRTDTSFPAPPGVSGR
jgi:hypothetical protein